MEKEEWKWVVGYEGRYEVSSLGRVRSYVDENYLRIMRQSIGRSGYPKLSLTLYGKSVCYVTHRLVAEAFIPNPLNKPFVNHKDGNKQNASAKNLEWVTSSENCLHAIRTGLFTPVAPRGERSCSPLSTLQVLQMRDHHSKGRSIQKLARDYGVSHTAVSRIVNRVNWKHI